MTGPTYPRPPRFSSAIGAFDIGFSPIGIRGGFDWWQTVISQYANSPRMMQLLADFYDYIDPVYLDDQFFDLVWNVDTAIGYGLDIWGRIVGVSRVIQVVNDSV